MDPKDMTSGERLRMVEGMVAIADTNPAAEKFLREFLSQCAKDKECPISVLKDMTRVLIDYQHEYLRRSAESN